MYLKTKNNLLKRCLTLFMSVCLLFMGAPAYAEINQKSELKVGNTYSGFELIKRDYAKNVKSYINQFEHEKTGAKLIYVENDDKQKMFSITFRTPCYDDTGVNHILEHSVLCGSEKFPVKNPFAKLLNKSLNTEMNAYTFPDKTNYPVASKYDKDFKNLVTVYLDAVFAPNITKTKNIFKQEGWRYELDSKKGELQYNGVVYNEMKGAYSNPQEVLMDGIKKSLFPDTGYKYQSGGNPNSIPKLTYEKYIETYKKHYHPSNSYTYIYGDVDIQNMLKYIDDNYFSKFDKENVNPKIDLQKPFTKQNTLESEYNVAKEEGTKDKTYFSLNYVVDTINNSQDYITLGLLNYLMFDSPKAPLKKALEEAGFNKANFQTQVLPILQPVESIILKNANIKDREKFNKVVNDTYKKIVEQGFDKQDVEELLNERLKDRKLDKAFDNFLSLNATILESQIGQNWIYDGDPTAYIDEKSVIKKIDNKVKNGEKYFENFLKKYLLNNNHSSFVTLNPKVGLEEEINENTKKALSKYKSSLSDKELNDLIKNCNEFKKWQNTPDSKEALNTLPKLSLEDLKKPVVDYPIEEKSVDGVKVLNHPVDTLGASYFNFYFNTKNVPQDKLVYINLLNSCYGLLEREFDTKNYTKDEFNKLSKQNEITITTLQNAMTKFNDDSVYKPMLTVGAVCPSDSIQKTVKLVNEILFNTKIDDKEKLKKTIKETAATYKEARKQGMMVATRRLQSYFSPLAKYSDDLDERYYDFIIDLDQNFDEKIDSVIKNLNEVKKLILNKENLVASFTSNKENFSSFRNSFSTFSENLGENKFVPCEYKFDNTAKNEAFITDEKVQTVTQGYNFNKLGYKYDARFDIAQSILNDYLFSTVRMQNGAYGAQALIQPTGSILLMSINDPNLKETLDIFKSSGDYLKNLNISDDNLKDYIIAAVGKYDEEVPPSFIGQVTDSFYMFGDSANEIYKMREQILNTKLEDINKCGDMVNEALKQNNYCVAGSREKIEKNKELFTKVIDVSEDNKNNNIFRIDGNNRYETAAKVAKSGWDKSDYAIVALGENYSDALSVVPLSKKYNAPILLTKTKELNSVTKDTLKDLKVKNVFVIGDNTVVSNGVEKEIEGMDIKVERLKDSIKVAQKLGNSENVIVANSKDFKQVLSIACEQSNNMPILLTKDEKTDKEIRTYIENAKIKSIYVVGNSVDKKGTDGLKNVKIIAQNANTINKLENGSNKDCMFVATKNDFSDALSGAALAVKYSAPLVLVDNKVNETTKEDIESCIKDVKNVYVIGGEKVIPSELFK